MSNSAGGKISVEKIYRISIVAICVALVAAVFLPRYSFHPTFPLPKIWLAVDGLTYVLVLVAILTRTADRAVGIKRILAVFMVVLSMKVLGFIVYLWMSNGPMYEFTAYRPAKWNMLMGIAVAQLLAALVAFGLFMFWYPRLKPIMFALLVVVALPIEQLPGMAPNNPDFIAAQNELEERLEKIDTLPRFDTVDDAKVAGVEEFVIENEFNINYYNLIEGDVSTLGVSKMPVADYSIGGNYSPFALLLLFGIYCYLPFSWVQRFQGRVGLARAEG